MKSEIRVSHKGLYITLGASLTFIVIFTIWTFSDVVAIGLKTAIALGVGYAGIKLALEANHAWHIIKSNQLDRDCKVIANRKLQIESGIISIHRDHNVLRYDGSHHTLAIAAHAGQAPAQVIEAQSKVVEPLPLLMDKIRQEKSVMFTGPKRQGKTNAALWWLDGRGPSRVGDPKNDGVIVNHWPQNCRVAGSLIEIDIAIKETQAELDRRRLDGNISAPPLTIFIDEVHHLITKGLDPIEPLMDIVLLGAEYNVHAAFTAHGITAKYLKVDAAALLQNFAVVRVIKMNGVFRAYFNDGAGEIEVQPPGPYQPQLPPASWPEPQYPDPINPAPPTEEERIIELIEAGETNYKIAAEVFGGRNDRIYTKIEALRKTLPGRYTDVTNITE
ncbi:MAG: hypothetical protein GY796_36500 [Chloroflexi bacterium]|nr:hypothetical protein [Chloroflexota bacterium]